MVANKDTAKYYQKIGSRIGYIVVMRRSQHFGYYYAETKSEPEAQKIYHNEFIKLVNPNPGQRILDAGCGQGVVASYIATQVGAKVYGITITPHEAKNANKKAKKLNLMDNLEFATMDYAKTKFKNEYFDIIYTTESLSHAVSVNDVLKEFNRILKPGGRLVCAEYEMDYRKFDKETQTLFELVRTKAAINAIYQFAPGQFVETAKDNKFTLEKEIDWTKNVKPSFDRIRRLGKPFNKLIKSLKLEKKFVNIIASDMYSNGVENDVFKYKVYLFKKRK